MRYVHVFTLNLAKIYISKYIFILFRNINFHRPKYCQEIIDMGQYRRRSFSAGHTVKPKSNFPTVSIAYIIFKTLMIL